MTAYELIEMAVLDALGILDEEERASFERAFAAAAPGLQAQVRAEQARLVDLVDLLPDEAPRGELRDLTLAAVRAAIAEQRTERQVAGRIGASAGAKAVQPRVSGAPRVHRVWRGAAIAMAAASLGLAAGMVQVYRYYEQSTADAVVNNFYDQIGPLLDDTLFNAQTKRVTFTPVAAEGTQAVAAVWHNPDWSSARLFIKNLVSANPQERFRLVVLDDDGNVVREVASFAADGRLGDIEVPVNLASDTSMAIYRSAGPTDAGTPVLRSNSADL
jgi:hypothetical protein